MAVSLTGLQAAAADFWYQGMPAAVFTLFSEDVTQAALLYAFICVNIRVVFAFFITIGLTA